MNLRQIPNALTVFRILAVIPLVVLLIVGKFGTALILALAAGASDLLDGYLARRFDWMTEFGSIWDPVADKLLLISTTVTLAALGHLPFWLVGLVIVRDAIIVVGGLYYHYRIAPVEPEPSWVSKFNTMFLILLVLAVILRLSGTPLDVQIIDGLVLVVAMTTFISGVDYVGTWYRKSKQVERPD